MKKKTPHDIIYDIIIEKVQHYADIESDVDYMTQEILAKLPEIADAIGEINRKWWVDAKKAIREFVCK